VGTYQPRLEPSGIKISDEKALKWLRNGAKPSETVEKLLKISGTWDIFEGNAPEPVAEPESKSEPEPASATDSENEPQAEAAPEPVADVAEAPA